MFFLFVRQLQENCLRRAVNQWDRLGPGGGDEPDGAETFDDAAYVARKFQMDSFLLSEASDRCA